MSWLLIPDGNMAKKQTHTPSAQKILRSLDERRLIIRTISGIFQRGRIMPAIRAILFIINSILLDSAAMQPRSKNIVRAKPRPFFGKGGVKSRTTLFLQNRARVRSCVYTFL